VVESLPLTSPTPKLHQPTSGSGHHHAWLLHLTAGLGYLLRTPRPAPADKSGPDLLEGARAQAGATTTAVTKVARALYAATDEGRPDLLGGA
jgi:hypothetical protein